MATIHAEINDLARVVVAVASSAAHPDESSESYDVRGEGRQQQHRRPAGTCPARPRARGSPRGVVAIQFFAPALDAFTFGWDSAAALGANVLAARVWLMILTAAITAAAVATSGAIGFIGLLVPHAVRILARPMRRSLRPLAALIGAVFLIWVDTFARTAFVPNELPVGVITALLGAPAYALVLQRVNS